MSNSEVWIDRLCVASVAKLITLSLRSASPPFQEVAYFEATLSGVAALEIWIRVTGIFGMNVSSEAVDHDLSEFRKYDPDSSTTDLRRDGEELAKTISKRACTDLLDSGLIVPRFRLSANDSRLRVYLERAVGNEDAVYDSCQKISLVYRTTVSDGHTGRPTVLLERTPFDCFRPEDARLTGPLRVETYLTLTRFLPLLRAGKQLLTDLSRAIYAAVRASIIDSGVSTSNPEPRIAVRFFHGVDFDKHNDLFWYPESGIDLEDVLVYFETGIEGTDADKQRIDNLGFTCVDFNEWRPERTANSYLRDVFSTLRVAVVTGVSAVRYRWDNGWWFWSKLVRIQLKTAWWRTFFEEWGVVANIHNSGDPNVMARIAAAEEADGIDVRYQWSNGHFLFPVLGKTLANHLYFCWGPTYLDQIRKQDMTPETTVFTGHLSRGVSSEQRERADRRYRKLREDGAETIVCLYDSSFSGHIHFTPKIFREFYLTVLEWALADPTLGIIVKPKLDNLGQLPEVKARIDELQARDQCVILESRWTPVESALSADLTVGMGINSAVFAGVGEDVPGVHFDLAGMEHSLPDYGKAIGRIVFQDGDHLKERIDARRDGSAPSVGDHSKWLEYIDAPHEGQAHERMGAYLAWYLEARKAGDGPREALTIASEKYADITGEQYVVTST